MCQLDQTASVEDYATLQMLHASACSLRTFVSNVCANQKEEGVCSLWPCNRVMTCANGDNKQKASRPLCYHLCVALTRCTLTRISHISVLATLRVLASKSKSKTTRKSASYIIVSGMELSWTTILGPASPDCNPCRSGQSQASLQP